MAFSYALLAYISWAAGDDTYVSDPFQSYAGIHHDLTTTPHPHNNEQQRYKDERWHKNGPASEHRPFPAHGGHTVPQHSHSHRHSSGGWMPLVPTRSTGELGEVPESALTFTDETPAYSEFHESEDDENQDPYPDTDPDREWDQEVQSLRLLDKPWKKEDEEWFETMTNPETQIRGTMNVAPWMLESNDVMATPGMQTFVHDHTHTVGQCHSQEDDLLKDIESVPLMLNDGYKSYEYYVGIYGNDDAAIKRAMAEDQARLDGDRKELSSDESPEETVVDTGYADQAPLETQFGSYDERVATQQPPHQKHEHHVTSHPVPAIPHHQKHEHQSRVSLLSSEPAMKVVPTGESRHVVTTTSTKSYEYRAALFNNPRAIDDDSYMNMMSGDEDENDSSDWTFPDGYSTAPSHNTRTKHHSKHHPRSHEMDVSDDDFSMAGRDDMYDPIPDGHSTENNEPGFVGGYY